MNRRLVTVVALMGGAALTLSACSGGGSAGTGGDELAKDGSFSMALDSDPGTLSPLMTISTSASQVINYLYDRMVFIDPATGSVKPWLAESWSEKPGEVVYTLKKGIMCSSGEPLTAQTVADNFTFVADKANNSPLRGFAVPGDLVATADDATGTVTLKTPTPSPFLLVNTASIGILCQSGLKKPDAVATESDGTGLFTLAEVVPNDHYTLTRRAGYSWGPDDQTTSETLGVPKDVTFKVISNPSTAANLLLSGELNAAVISGADEDRLASAGLAKLSTNRPMGEMFYNQLNGKATSDPAVRLALTKAVDIPNLAKIITADKGAVSKQLSGVSPVGCQMETTGALPAADFDGAAAALTAAGWIAGNNGKRVKDGKALELAFIYNNATDTSNAAAEFAQQQWTKLGASVSIKGGDENFMVEQLLSGKNNADWDIAWENVNVSVPSTIVPLISGPAPSEGLNFGSIRNAGYEAGVAKASVLTGEQACAAWGEAEESLFTSADVVPFASAPSSTYLHKASAVFDTVASGPLVRVKK
ncbi:ABC transporter substrate-binding protein [Paenarthrobacter sp. NPDC056912]|uniref:ABC transporter substrate-binding protein n=1 Tax=Paenarthrobacter sp. NPDC056912 TaxID=3345965 RepID=UPI00366B2D06